MPQSKAAANTAAAEAAWRRTAFFRLRGEGMARKTVNCTDAFLFPFVFSFAEGGQEQGQRFLTLLYCWASILAKADRVISSEEIAWLANIMKLTGDQTAGQAISKEHVQSDSVISRPLQELDKMIGLALVKT